MLAPLALVQLTLPLIPPGGAIINVTSDAAVEPYDGWGGYGSSKAALDQLTAILAAEQPHLHVYAVDPGDMRTRMHQEAFPGEDISDRPPPEESVPGLLALIDGELPSGRYQARAILDRRRQRRGCLMSALAFELPHRLEATEPPEQRGLARDAVRLLVADASAESLIHARFHELPQLLAPGDLVVVNVSATLPAALPGRHTRDGRPVRVHVATRAPRARRALARRRTAQPRWVAPSARPRRRDDRARGRRGRAWSWSRPTRRAPG